MINALSDARLDPFRDLPNRRSGPPDDLFIAEGQLVVQRLLASSLHVESVLVEDGKHSWVDNWADQFPIIRLSRTLIRQLAGFDFHRGILASARRPSPPLIADILSEQPRDAASIAEGHGTDIRGVATGSLSPLLLFMCGVSDKENVGSIIRTATAFGITDIVFDQSTADPFTRRVLRVSMGTVFKQRFFISEDVAEDVRRLSRIGGYRTIATTLQRDAADLQSFVGTRLSHSPPLALLIGSEANGLPEHVEQAATDRVTIPMQLQTDSLNVSVATGILLYAITQMRPDLQKIPGY